MGSFISASKEEKKFEINEDDYNGNFKKVQEKVEKNFDNLDEDEIKKEVEKRIKRSLILKEL
jgi:hypothetical protein